MGSRLAENTTAITDLKNMMAQLMTMSSASPQPQPQRQGRDQWQSHWQQDGHIWNRADQAQSPAANATDNANASGDEFGSLDPDSTPPGHVEMTTDRAYGVDIITSDFRGSPYGR